MLNIWIGPLVVSTGFPCICAHLVPSFPFHKLGCRDSILELENWRLGETECLCWDCTAGKLHALATHLPLRPRQHVHPVQVWPRTVRSPHACSISSLSIATLSKQECEKLPRARDLTSWWIKVLACMEFAFQEGDWSWARKDLGDKSYKENKTQACDRVGWRRLVQLGRVAQEEGSQRGSWDGSWWEGEPVLQKPREEHSRGRTEHVHCLSGGKSWTQRRGRVLPQLGRMIPPSSPVPCANAHSGSFQVVQPSLIFSALHGPL